MHTSNLCILFHFNRHKYNFNFLNNLISGEDWLALLNYSDVNIALDIFKNKILKFINKSESPIFKKTNKYHKLKNWIMSGIVVFTKTKKNYPNFKKTTI